MGSEMCIRDRKLLGITVDQRLTFAAHARGLRTALQPRVLELRRLMSDRRIPSRLGLLLYKVFLRSCLLYGAPALITASDSVWEVLERLQRAAIRASLRVPVGVPVASLLTWSRLPPARQAYEEASISFLRWCHRHGNRRVLDSIPEPGGVPHRAFVQPPLNATLDLLPPAERNSFPH